MFTGIVSDLGEVVAVSAEADRLLRIATHFPHDGIDEGASIACSGICLTVIERGPHADGRSWFTVTASAETLARTTAGSWRPGTRLNLERALKVGDELGGHIVTGHVDGVGTLTAARPDGASRRLEIAVPGPLAPYIAEKGSITLDGVSLTVNAVSGDGFGVNIIPYTQTHTTLGALAPGAPVNLEIDVLARYVARLRQFPEAVT
ncbi:MAG: riboflavin synthase [Alphaproteobacteria bacterium]|nr:riboflavin synthase [Alphaproteobacteria bacterium]